MSEPSRRAVLLARPGAACERLRSALSDAGANVVLEADPTTLQLETLGQVGPQVVVVALDPVTEDVIERFDPVLADPSVEVIYEEAALAATREGWDLARWMRHLAAKLHGHGDVLPPGHEPEGMEPPEPPVAIASPAVEAVAPIEVATPVEPPRVAEVAAVPPQVSAPVVEVIEIADCVVEPVIVPVAVTPVAVVEVAAPAAETAGPVTQCTLESHPNPFDPVAAEAASGSAESTELPQSLASVELAFAADAPALSTEEAKRVIELFESSFDFEIAGTAPTPVVLETPIPEVVETSMDAPVAQAPASVSADAPVLMFDASREGALPAAPRAEAAAPAAPDWSFADDTPTATQAPREADPHHKFNRDLGDIERRIGALELVEDRPVSPFNGAVLVLAGIGGPDAVRQLLGGLPEEFPRPVLVQQRLDGGRYDRLVAQMQRATPLQVRLAEPGLFAMAGTIYILPAEISITVSESGMRFVEGDGDVLGTLPTGDSAVLMLSGADAAQVDAAMNLSWAGGLVAGQAPDGCYDAAASSALIVRGAQSGQPAELAARLAERWR